MVHLWRKTLEKRPAYWKSSLFCPTIASNFPYLRKALSLFHTRFSDNTLTEKQFGILKSVKVAILFMRFSY
jgi:hypothetical protein